MLGSISVAGVAPTAPVQTPATPPQGQAAASSSGQGASSAAQSSDASKGLLTATYVPSRSPAGGTYKVVEKDTGQVVVELPREVTLSPGEANSPQPPGIDLTA